MAEKNEQFQKEVTWCIEQLRIGMQDKKPSQKQVKECERVIKILTSKKASLVKKRQTMHQMFGDYRKKIESDEKAWEKDTLKQLQNMNISSVTSCRNHGRFLKSAKVSPIVASNLSSESELPGELSHKNTDVDDNIANTDSIKSPKTSCIGIQNDSNEDFKFNFNIEA